MRENFPQIDSNKYILAKQTKKTKFRTLETVV